MGYGDNEEDKEDLKKYTEEKIKKEQQKKKKKENDDHEDEEQEDDDYNYNYQMYSGKSQSDDEKDLFCPNERCKTKLGSKQWQGTQCSCGAWVIPAFKILLSKVDAIPIREQQQQESSTAQNGSEAVKFE